MTGTARTLIAGTVLGGAIATVAFVIGTHSSQPRNEDPAALVHEAGSGSTDAGAPEQSKPMAVQAASIERDGESEAPPRTIEIEGEAFVIRTNGDGAILQSANGKRIYVGRDCDVQSDTFGKGSWEWSNAGFAFHFGARDLTFPRMDPPLDTDRCEA